MSITEITDRVTSLGHAWEQFKHVNDARLAEIERKGNADPLYDEHLHNISSALDNYKNRLDQIIDRHREPELDRNRPGDGQRFEQPDQRQPA